jgi:hypothetical protein
MNYIATDNACEWVQRSLLVSLCYRGDVRSQNSLFDLSLVWSNHF